MIVPQINFTDTDRYVSFGYAGSYYSAADLVAKIAISMASQGTILSIAPPVENASYTTTFYGPAIRCTQATDTTLSTLRSADGMEEPGISRIIYSAWVPSSAHPNITSPNLNPANASGLEVDYSLDMFSTDLARLFVYSNNAQCAFTCGLYNTSYTAAFTFSVGTQTIIVNTGEVLNNVSSAVLDTEDDPYLMVDGTTPAYLALMESLGRVLVGSISDESRYDYEQSPDLTSIKDTSLNDLRKGTNATAFGLALEELFQNLTISLLSDATFRQPRNLSSPVDVAMQLTRNIYTYHPFDLVLAYAIGCLATSLCLAIGIGAILRTSSSHSNSFSAISRATRDPDLDALVSSWEASGAEPLPHVLGKTVVRLSEEKGERRGFEVMGSGKPNG